MKNRFWRLIFVAGLVFFAGCVTGKQMTGRIVGPDGAPVAAPLFFVPEKQGAATVKAVLGPDGEYTAKGLMPGTAYVLTPSGLDWEDVRVRGLVLDGETYLFTKDGWLEGKKPAITIGEKDETLPPIRISPYVSSISGSIQNADKTPVPNLSVHLVSSGGSQPVKTLATDENGRFLFEGLTPLAAYTLVFQPSGQAASMLWAAMYHNVPIYFTGDGWLRGQELSVSAPGMGEVLDLVPIPIFPAISGVSGRVVMATGKPAPGVLVVAEKKGQGPGPDRLETKSDAEGRFFFGRLFPQTEHQVYAVYREHPVGIVSVVTPKPGTVFDLEKDISIRFVSLDQGVLQDLATGLYWAPDPGRSMSWAQAEGYAANLSLGGFSDWRLPSLEELKTISDKESVYPYKLPAGLRLSAPNAWSANRKGSGSAWYFMFSTGYPSYDSINIDYNTRVLCVRGGR